MASDAICDDGPDHCPLPAPELPSDVLLHIYSYLDHHDIRKLPYGQHRVIICCAANAVLLAAKRAASRSRSVAATTSNLSV